MAQPITRYWIGPEMAEDDPNRDFAIYSDAGIVPQRDLTEKEWERHGLAKLPIGEYWSKTKPTPPPDPDQGNEESGSE